MPAKKVSIGTKPTAQKSENMDQWVADRSVEPAPNPQVKMKRLTLDIPEPLHRAIKRKAVEDGVAMADLLRSLLEEKYGNQ
jgi:predicted DNA binding CopG/RHH family protein